MSVIRIGLLTEDQTDADAVAILVKRIAKEVRGVEPGVHKHWEKGCARVRRKARAKMEWMQSDGCTAAIIVHDLDRNPINQQLNDHAFLRDDLESIPVPTGLVRHVCIPIEELEAWFWADDETVKLATHNNKHARAHHSPESIKQPKEQFERLSRGTNGKSRYNTNKNPDLAEKLNIALCEKRCPSFRALVDFVRTVIP